MNVGLGSLTLLKKHLLSEQLRAGTKYDAQLTAIGKGVAVGFDNYCNRSLVRVEDGTFTCTPDRDHVFVPRYPIESISSVELKDDADVGWVTQIGFIQNFNGNNGQIFWGSMVAPDWAQLRFTYTGGYWVDETEEGNDTLPDGAEAVPDDLVNAWLLQCRAVWQAVDKLGTDIIKTGSSSQFVTGSLGGLDLVPDVKNILNGYIRFQIT